MPFIFGAPRSRTSTLIVDSDIVMPSPHKIVSPVIKSDDISGITKCVYKGSIEQVYRMVPKTPVVYHIVYSGNIFVANTNFFDGSSGYIQFMPPGCSLIGDIDVHFTGSFAGCSAQFVSYTGAPLGALAEGINSIPDGTIGVYVVYSKGNSNAGGSAALEIAEYTLEAV